MLLQWCFWCSMISIERTRNNTKFRIMYSQTWVNDHLRIVTTCLQRQPFKGPILNFYHITVLWTTTTCQQWPLFLGPEGGRCTQVWLLYWVIDLVVRQLLLFITFSCHFLTDTKSSWTRRFVRPLNTDRVPAKVPVWRIWRLKITFTDKSPELRTLLKAFRG